ncbi:CDK5 regulatory subunit-associated protein 2 isoform 5-T5 [Callospermophilus lateralis]|uniref:CDK5 regulatory subunit-associated protein 2 isoform X6 n=1 Tax=Callospermophilus lateralis TaxID=76772 RepID=UPI004038D514
MMDSVLEEDVTLPGTLSGCSDLAPACPDDLDGINNCVGLENGELPQVSEEKVSPTRVRNMKDFENQITELKKENFNLKLRIYFLEERLQQELDGPTEHVYKTNIELKVEVESLKRELQEREQLLIKASKAVESLAEGGGSEIQRVKEDAQKKVQQVEDLLTKRILLLEGDVKAAQAELEKAFAGTETEKALRLSLESKLSEMKKMHKGDLEMVLVLEEKDRLIEELKLSLKSREALIQCLEEEKSQTACLDENVSSGELRRHSAALREEKERDAEAAQMEHQKERSHFEEMIQALQKDLREKEREIATEKKNSLKRDKAIQGLTMALKSKEKEVEELNSEIKELSSTFAEAKEALQKTQEAQILKCQGSEGSQAALTEKEALLAELRSENLTKSSENHRLRRSIKKVTQELSDLQQEKARLERDLEEARCEGSRGARTIQDLRNEVEKLCNEVNEREKAMENCYKSLLSESNNKLRGQEQVIRHLIERASQKDPLLQKFNEKDLEAVQQNRCLMTAEDLEFGSEGLITEKCSSQQSPGSKLIFSQEKEQSDYEKLIQVLQQEQDIYAQLVRSLQDSDSMDTVQAELNNIFALRKQLERDVLTYRNLQKSLVEQISEIRRREEEPFSFYSDQTSYLSICLEENSQFQVEHFSQEELKKKVSELVQLVKELYTDNQRLKKTIFDLSCEGFQGNGRPESTEQREITEDYAKLGNKNGYLRHTDSNILDYEGAHKPGCPGDQSQEAGELLGLLAPFLHEKAALSLESRNRPDLLKMLGDLLLERICLAEQEVSGKHLDGKTEKTLQQMVIQQRGELEPFVQASSFSKPHDEQKLTWDQLAKTGEVAKVELKDASVQTVAKEGDLLGFRQGGEKPSDTILNAEPQPETWCQPPGHQATPLSGPCASHKDTKKSRLPILIKPSRSLGNVYHLPATQGVIARLQGQILELQGELKEFKTRNKQLHQKLILAEAMMEGRPKPDPMLLNVPAAQPLVGPAYQQSPGEQMGTTAMPSAHKDREVDDNQQTSLRTGKSSGVELSPQNEPMERTEEDNVDYQRLLPESPGPFSSHALSDDEISEKSFLSREQKQDSVSGQTSVMADHFSQDLLMEHIQEIRTLRKRLEESIKTNEKLRKQLERQGSEFDQGATNILAYGSELHNSLTSEINFLRKQNQTLNAMLLKGSQDKQKENEKLRESLSGNVASLERLQQEHASVRGENERLRKEVSERDRLNQQLSQELDRAQKEVQWRQQLLSQNHKLLQSLRVELKVYVRLDEEHQRLRQETGAEAPEGWKGQELLSDLHDLLTEIQALRAQLEGGIKTNSTLQSKLEEQLAQGEKAAQEGDLSLAVQAPGVPDWTLQLDKHDDNKCPLASSNSSDLESTRAVMPKSVSETPPLSGNDVDSFSCISGSSVTSTPCLPRMAARLWASRSGRHILGLIEDYDALCEQIHQGQRLLAEMDMQTQEASSPMGQELRTKGLHLVPLSKFVSSVSTARLILEEASRLLKLLWRVSLPTDGQCTLHCGQIGEMKAEIIKLQNKLFEQEKKLQNSMRLLQQSKHQEKVIFDQLLVTHKVLRKARGNLELRPGGAHPGTASPNRPGS